MSRERCSDLSRAADEPLVATATTATDWLLVEVPGTWPRDVSTGESLPEAARDAIAAWRARTPGSRLLFVRRPRRPRGPLLALVVQAHERIAEVRRIELAEHGELADLDLASAGEVVGTSLVLVCGHGARDTCCSLRGAAVHRALAEAVPSEVLWISSHQGGHRFAANVLVLPAGLQLGRVEPGEAPRLVSLALEGRIELDRYRGRSCYEPVAQAAEHAVRASAGLDRVADLRLVAVQGLRVAFEAADGARYEATVERHAGPVLPASCGAEAEEQPVLAASLR
jgi:hypothetical protein